MEREYCLRLARDEGPVLRFKAYDIVIVNGCARVVAEDGGTTAAFGRGEWRWFRLASFAPDADIP